MLKAVIIIGGPQNGTRFRPLSLDVPKPLFPVAGLPMIQHHIEACVKVPNLKEIVILGSYPVNNLTNFVTEMNQKYSVSIRYLQEYAPLGTAGGIYHFRDQIRYGNPEGFFLLHGDVCGEFPLEDILKFHKSKENGLMTIMATETSKQQALNYGCIAKHQTLDYMTHYVEKPSTFVSTLINCGVYFCSVNIFDTLSCVFKKKQDKALVENAPYDANGEIMHLEEDVLTPLAETGQGYVYVTKNWWSQLKIAGAAIYANRHYLSLYRLTNPDRLADDSEMIVGDVYIDPTAVIDPSASIGPNVSIGANVTIGPGVRLKDAIILNKASVGSHTLITNAVVGPEVKIGSWTRVEGTPCDPNPNKPFAKIDSLPLFNKNGRLNPSTTIIGCSVKVPSEVILLNSIVLPYKELTRSFKNEIIL